MMKIKDIEDKDIEPGWHEDIVQGGQQDIPSVSDSVSNISLHIFAHVDFADHWYAGHALNWS